MNPARERHLSFKISGVGQGEVCLLGWSDSKDRSVAYVRVAQTDAKGRELSYLGTIAGEQLKRFRDLLMKGFPR